ncbi:AAA family ATPase, partial [candidate division KSB1 bacterium]|nr:AAA family ATPase [candidate division KSB1 bacterium]
MAKKIEKISLCTFKGASSPLEIEFDKNKAAVMIFGENGTGKSTIVDAIDFICNGKWGSLDDRSVGSNKSMYIPTLGQKTNDLEAKLMFNGTLLSGKIGKGNQPEILSDVEKPTLRILRRCKILELVNGKPKDRYEALKDFIEVPNCQKAEQSLRDEIRATEQNFEQSRRSVKQALESLESFWIKEGKPGNDYLLWAKEKTETDQSIYEKQIKEICSLLDIIDQCKRNEKVYKNKITEFYRQNQEFNSRQEAMQKEVAREDKDVSNLIELLEDTEKYIEKNSTISKCPVCEQIVDVKLLKSRIKERLEAMNKQRQLKKAIENAKSQLEQKSILLKSSAMDFLREIQKLSLILHGSQCEIINKFNFDKDIVDEFANIELIPLNKE